MATKANIHKAKKISVYVLALALISVNYDTVAQSYIEYYNVALVKYNIRDYDGANADLSKAIEQNPDYAQAFNLRGMVNYKLEKMDGAVEDYTRAIELYIRPPEGLSIKVIDQKGNLTGIQSAQKNNPNLAVSYYNRGLVRKAEEDFEKAINDFTSAIDNDPELTIAYYNRGLVKQALGNIESACEDWGKSAEYGYAPAIELLLEHCEYGATPK